MSPQGDGEAADLDDALGDLATIVAEDEVKLIDETDKTEEEDLEPPPPSVFRKAWGGVKKFSNDVDFASKMGKKKVKGKRTRSFKVMNRIDLTMDQATRRAEMTNLFKR